MIKFGTLKEYRQAKKMLTDAGFTITEKDGELVKKALVDGVEAVSVARLNGNSWVFRYNPNFFSEAK